MIRLLIKFVNLLHSIHEETRMFHNDISLLNICYHEQDDTLYLIDYERIRNAEPGENNVDMVSFFNQVLYELSPSMLPNQQDLIMDARHRLTHETIDRDSLVTLMENILKVAPL